MTSHIKPPHIAEGEQLRSRYPDDSWVFRDELPWLIASKQRAKSNAQSKAFYRRNKNKKK